MGNGALQESGKKMTNKAVCDDLNVNRQEKSVYKYEYTQEEGLFTEFIVVF